MVAELTPQLIKEAKPKPSAPYYIMDTITKGFNIRVYPGGRKVYSLRYRDAKGKARALVIGECERYPLKVAREDVAKMMKRINAGLDPDQY